MNDKGDFLTPIQQKQLLWIAWELFQGAGATAIRMAQEIGDVDNYTSYYDKRHRNANKELMFFISLNPEVGVAFHSLDEEMPEEIEKVNE